MSWWTWAFLFGSTVSGSIAAVSQYFAWSFRYRILWLGITSEISLAAAIFFLAGSGLSALLGHMPR